mmetsp:Transcript_115636/g.247122  ORF Transcript_115636/g.247122 Transcript_115636/m.247122 type:complete len:380 (-) Transcript_115636:17-1156(-)
MLPKRVRDDKDHAPGSGRGLRQRLADQREPIVLVHLVLIAVRGCVRRVSLHPPHELIELCALGGALLDVRWPMPLVMVEHTAVPWVDVEGQVLVDRVWSGVVEERPSDERRDHERRLRPQAALAAHRTSPVAVHREEHEVAELAHESRIPLLCELRSLEGQGAAHVEAADAIEGSLLFEVISQVLHDLAEGGGRLLGDFLAPSVHIVLGRTKPSLVLTVLARPTDVAEVAIVSGPALLPVGDEERCHSRVRMDLLNLLVDLALVIVPLEDLEVYNPWDVLEHGGDLAFRHRCIRARAMKVENLLRLEVAPAVALVCGRGVLPGTGHLLGHLLGQELRPYLVRRRSQRCSSIVKIVKIHDGDDGGGNRPPPGRSKWLPLC